MEAAALLLEKEVQIGRTLDQMEHDRIRRPSRSSHPNQQKPSSRSTIGGRRTHNSMQKRHQSAPSMDNGSSSDANALLGHPRAAFSSCRRDSVARETRTD